ncbi:MAG: hypothetical protein CO118_07310, partial [Flavobacteriales bacterium CG_4_9_14_3_um_filter_32_8]
KTPWKNLENQKIGFDLSLNNISTFVEKIDFLASLSNKDFYEYSFNAYRLGLKTNSSHQNIAAYQQLFHL